MKRIFVVAMVTVSLAGCVNSNSLSGDVYSKDEAKAAQSVSYGTVVSARAVKIQASESSVLGTIGGAVLGGLIGHSIGGGTGNKIATAGGAIAGAAAGSKIEGAVNQVDAVELEVRRENGSTFVVVQKGNIKSFYAGQAVRITASGDGKVSVSPR